MIPLGSERTYIDIGDLLVALYDAGAAQESLEFLRKYGDGGIRLAYYDAERGGLVITYNEKRRGTIGFIDFEEGKFIPENQEASDNDSRKRD